MDRRMILYYDDGMDSRIVEKRLISLDIEYIPLRCMLETRYLPALRHGKNGSDMTWGLRDILEFLDDIERERTLESPTI